MISFIRRILNSEILPVSEVRKLKVHIVMIFLFIITLVTIPFSFFFNYSTLFQVLSLVTFGLFYLLCLIFVRYNKIFTAIQISIIYTILLMAFYTRGISSFYAYIFFYITLTVIVFYQEIYSYFLYGTLTVILGIFYTLAQGEGLFLINDIIGARYIYIAGLVIYYWVSFINILNSEKLYADMNLEWVKLNNFNGNLQKDILYHLEDIRTNLKKTPLYEDVDFQKATFEIGGFLSEQLLDDFSKVDNLIDLYIYIHEKGLDSILKNNEISIPMKKKANILGKYLLNKNTDMFSMLISFYLKYQKTEQYHENRYQYHLDSITNFMDEQIIGFTLIYIYLHDEMSMTEEWKTINLKGTSLNSIFAKIDIHEFFSDTLIDFYLENMEKFKNTLK